MAGYLPGEVEEAEEHWVPTWRELATEDQQQLYEVFGDRTWDSFKPSERVLFGRKVSYALYGAPENTPSADDPFGYGAKKLEHMRPLVAKIEELQKGRPEGTDVLFAVLFVSMKLKDSTTATTPVFRIPSYSNTNAVLSNYYSFIDSEVRVYIDWADYLKNNKLPRCECCYPRDGIYLGDNDGNVYIDFGVSPACTVRRRIGDGLDTVSTVVTVGASAVGLAAVIPAIPVAAPVVLASVIGGVVTGVYGMGRSINTLVDRGKHSQSIGLKDSKARNCWLATAGSVLGIASGAAVKGVSYLARNGEVVGRFGCVAVTALNVSAVTVNGVGVANGLYSLIERGRNDTLTPLDVFQFSMSVFFFTNSMINFQTAESIILENQNTAQSHFSDSLRSNRHRKMFRKAAANTKKGHGLMEGNAEVIKSIKHINNKDDFFAGLVRVNKQCNKNNAKITLSPSGGVEINKAVVIDPMEFSMLSQDHRQEIFQGTKKVADGKITSAQFENKTKYTFNGNNVSSVHPTTETVTNAVNTTFGTKHLKDILISGKSLLSELPPQELCKLGSLVVEPLCRKCLKVIVGWCEKIACDTAKEFFGFAEFAYPYVVKILHEMEEVYQMCLREAQRNDPDFNLLNFNYDNGIHGNRLQFFLNLITELYKVGEKFQTLKSDYETFKENRRTQYAGATSEQYELRELNEFAAQVRNTVDPTIASGFFHDDDDDVVTESLRLDDTHYVLTEGHDMRINSERQNEGESTSGMCDSSSAGGSSGFLGGVVSPSANDEAAGEGFSVTWDSSVQGALTFDRLYTLASIATGVPVTCNNSSILHDELVMFVTVRDPQMQDNVVMITDCKEESKVKVTVLGQTL